MTSGLPHGYRQIGEDRIRESVGLAYPELAPGLTIEHRPGRTVTEVDSLLGAALSGNVAPLHTDAHYSSQTQWGRILVCSGVTLNLVAGMTVRSISGLTTANLAVDQVRFTAPVHIGDTLYAETKILTRRASESRPDTGVITCHTTAHNQDNTSVLAFTRTFLVPLDADAARDATHY
ncbi:MaoC family dehydratase [Streptomyces hirsutus]|uniref:MaoC family dehydratase n=1 Tax=Streptomyces hirsutus TaxID=35620 RepID=A0ABZ1GMM9_9ACTN|nr:MaoC family dehydratase [Streptomyces hirsutus]WSD06490.1 MaoC family dehydratase [Streptomyces hirsutus]WTD20101.1 MaoC family dehydratase [Streptomyces hirsutus]